MCWRPCCPFFRKSSIREGEETQDDVTNILIFGITGMTGGAVMEAALGCAWFRVTGFTRASKGEVYDDLVSKGVTLFTGDMNKPHTLVQAMKDIDCVFLNTAYWDSMNVDREYKQGVNVVNCAVENAVKHLIYAGTDYNMLLTEERCKYLEGKARVENYIVTVGIPFTVVHLGFYYENFLSVFKPHQTGKNEYAIALPMGSFGMNCGSVMDFGHMIGRIALRPETYVFKTLKLATAYLTVSAIAHKFQKHFPNLHFYNPQIPLKAYKEFTFEGAEELATMFAHYRTMSEWDRSAAMELNPTSRSIDQWIKDSERQILDILTDAEHEALDTSWRQFVPGHRGADTHYGVADKILSAMPFQHVLGPMFGRFTASREVTFPDSRMKPTKRKLPRNKP